MKDKTYIDGFLVDWGEVLFAQGLSPKVKRQPRTILGGIGSGRMRPISPKGVLSVANKASVIRQKLKGIVNRSTEVMVKITGGGKGMVQIKNHFDYISRNGQLPLETHLGEYVEGRDELSFLRDAWQYGDMSLIPEVSSKREAFNIVFSMPEGTDPAGVTKAVRDFATREFDGHQYAMAVHSFETDPDPNPSHHPHVHLVVKAEGRDGRRLNPRKADLQRWREGFALALGENGIEANATPKKARLRHDYTQKKVIREMKMRGESPDRAGVSPAGPERIEKARLTETRVKASYDKITTLLAQSDDREDQLLAASLKGWIKEQVRDEPRDLGPSR